MIRLFWVFGLCVLAGCASQQASAPKGVNPAGLVEACCEALEIYPGVLVRLAEMVADIKPADKQPVRIIAPALSDRPEIWAYLARYLRPLDIVLTSNKGHLSGSLVPGFLTHAQVYLGTEAQLRRAGLWDLQDLVPHHARIRAGQVFYEAMPPRVDFVDVAHVLDVDAIAIWRPPLSGEERRDVLARLLKEYGKPFDRMMDSRNHACLYCTELLSVAYPMFSFVEREAYGRPVILPDEIAAGAIRGQLALQFVGFVHRADGAVVSAPLDVLAANIAAYWPD